MRTGVYLDGIRANAFLFVWAQWLMTDLVMEKSVDEASNIVA
jgi:hypothetical protein